MNTRELEIIKGFTDSLSPNPFLMDYNKHGKIQTVVHFLDKLVITL